MKRMLVLLSTLLMVAAAAVGHEGHEQANKGDKTVTLTGEVVDLTCYMQHPESAVGVDHVKCAKSCIAKGLPIGFLSSTGTLYTVIGQEHEPVSAQVTDWLGKPSTVTGTMIEHDGTKAIVLGSIRAAGTKMTTEAQTQSKSK